MLAVALRPLGRVALELDLEYFVGGACETNKLAAVVPGKCLRVQRNRAVARP